MIVARTAGAAVLVIATVVTPASAQIGEVTAAVTVPIEGRFERGGEFAGTATINRFEQRGESIVAIGVVTATLRRGNRSVASVLAAPVTWPVVVRVNGMVAARSGAAAPARIMPARFRLAQAPCPSLSAQIGLSGIDVSVAGVDLAISPLTIDLSGDPDEPLGSLVCQIGDLIGNVAGLVGLLNQILSLVTGLLGNVVGGVVPPVP
jgi:hypothetical protein